MQFSATVKDKTIGTNQLFKDLELHIAVGEKIAIIGRNGVGKTTLFRILSGVDSDFEGDIRLKRGTTIVMTSQEHIETGNQTCIEYILDSFPQYRELHGIIENYPADPKANLKQITRYSEAVNQFSELGYYEVEEKVLKALADYQIDRDMALGPLAALSGGQKRFVELVKVQQSGANVALIDEPTNHMDYVAKKSFIDWLQHVPSTVLVISHDRDVLQVVDRIIEIKDKRAKSYKGNYRAYLKQNSVTSVTDMAQYEISQRSIENIKKQIMYARSKKASWGGTADKKNPFVVMEERLTRELKELQQTEKPSFWIDRESTTELKPKAVMRYEKYKDKNIRLNIHSNDQASQELLRIENLSLGYSYPLFANVNFALKPGERIRLHGRNGAGKTTLINYIVSLILEHAPLMHCYDGEAAVSQKLRLGMYEQEIDERYLDKELGEAIEQVFDAHNKQISEQDIRRILVSYLFDPMKDYHQIIRVLSGGQKARFQIISMLANDPNLLVLDEPTNHLDLPSIEELEHALQAYNGAVLYVSHDSLFTTTLAATVVEIG